VIQLLPPPIAGADLAESKLSRAFERDTILLVEDQEIVRSVVVLALERVGYEVISAGNAAEAARQLYEKGGEITLAIIDLQLGDGLNGLELADRFRRINPAMRIILTTGQAAAELPQIGGYNVLPKPFGASRLGQAVREALDESLAWN